MQTRAKTKSQSINLTPELMSELSPQVVVEEDIPASDEDKSTLSPLAELATLIKSMKPKSDAGKFKEPEPFTGQDPKKLKAFIFQCQLYFRSLSDFNNSTRWVNFALSYLKDVAQEWFKLGISGLTSEPPVWLSNWDAFVEELCHNFGPFDEQGDAETELMNLYMKDGQQVSDYLIQFLALSLWCAWGESPLKFRFYEGLPNQIKDKLSKGEGKHQPLEDLQCAAQKIDAHYWERVQECSREQHTTQKQNLSKMYSPTTSSNVPTSSQSRLTDQRPTKTKETAKLTTPRVDLTSKLDSHGKLTQQEWQNRIDRNLCLFCGGAGHQANNCPVKARSAKGQASTAVTDLTPTKEKDSGTGAKKG